MNLDVQVLIAGALRPSNIMYICGLNVSDGRQIRHC